MGQANYAAAKAGLIGMTQSLAAEVGKRQIRVNCVLPGFLETKMTRDLPDDVVANAKSQHVLGKFNKPEAVAHFIECLQGLTAISGASFPSSTAESPRGEAEFVVRRLNSVCLERTLQGASPPPYSRPRVAL